MLFRSRTRHNAGFWLVERFALQSGVALRMEGKFQAIVGRLEPAGGSSAGSSGTWLVLPQGYMNASGRAVQMLAGFFKIPAAEILVVHDELDFAPGRLQIKTGGGLAGHNGLRSIAGVVGTQDFTRLRIGIGKPPHKEQGADFVLKRLTGPARTAVELDVAAAADAIELILDVGLTVAQQQVNAGMRG